MDKNFEKLMESLQEGMLKEYTTWGDLNWDVDSAPDFNSAGGKWLVKDPSGNSYKVVGADEKFLKFWNPSSAAEEKILVGDAFVHGMPKKRWKLFSPDGKEVPVDLPNEGNPVMDYQKRSKGIIKK